MKNMVIDFLAMITALLERMLFRLVWVRRNSATGRYEAKDLEYARSKNKPIFISRRQLYNFWKFIGLIICALVILYLLAWFYFTVR